MSVFKKFYQIENSFENKDFQLIFRKNVFKYLHNTWIYPSLIQVKHSEEKYNQIYYVRRQYIYIPYAGIHKKKL